MGVTGVIRVASAVVLGVTATAVTPGVAFAARSAPRAEGGTSFSFAVAPEAVAPGGRVTLSVDGCPHTARVSSDLFATVTIPEGRTTARTRIHRDARPGTVHQVSFRCGRETGVTELRVRAARPGPAPTPTRPAPVPSRPGHSGSPVPAPPPGGHSSRQPEHGAHAGAGGATAGFDLGDLGLGALLVAGALATAYRRTRSTTTTDDQG
ncbi:hypothetical protein [Streptomyces sp. CO7]